MKPSTRPASPCWRSPLAACALAVALGAPPAHARHPDLDLDKFSEAQLTALILRELDDDDLEACGLEDLNGPVAADDLIEVLMCALGDDNDDDDEDDLDLDDLEAECVEAGTHVVDVVRGAVASVQRRADAAGIRLAFAAPLAGAPEQPAAWEALDLLLAQGSTKLFVRPPKSGVVAAAKAMTKVVLSVK